ncbi:MAG: sulfite exporter TauE/SafE family protein [Candidatus Hydrogenedentes bacterium]|nr:sulfite exporter TauE/SafE family protein [Candidatus Hydrogenedentota bacterium]
MTIALYCLGMLVLGAGVGLISAALGLGGGILMVPAFLTFVPGMDAHTAKGTSLFIIIFVAALNAWRLNRGQQERNWDVAGAMAVGSIVGGYAGAWVTSRLPDQAVIWIYVVFLVGAALRTFLIKPVIIRKEQVRRRSGFAVLIGMAGGAVGGGTGTGGGLIMVPLSLIAGIISNERVVALSNMVMVATGIAGTVAHFTAPRTLDLPGTIGHVSLALTPLVFIGAQLAAPLGHRLETQLTLPRRKAVMGVLLLAISVRLAYQVLR